MRKILALGLLLAFLLLVPTAGLWATSMDVFTFTGTWAGTPGSQPFAASPFTLTFTAPASPTPCPGCFNVNLFQVSVNGSYTNNGTTTPFSGSPNFNVNGGFGMAPVNFLTLGDQFIITANGPPNPVLFSGSTSSPTFIPGTYSLTGAGHYTPPPPGITTGRFFSGTLTIAPAPVPEPGTLLLLGTGLLGVVGAARRKWHG